MKNLKACLLVLVLGPTLWTISSCSSNTSKTEEKSQDSTLTAIDSVSTTLKTENDKLENEAKKVEESLAKAEKEFNQAK